jgi:hypothetical protein
MTLSTRMIQMSLMKNYCNYKGVERTKQPNMRRGGYLGQQL